MPWCLQLLSPMHLQAVTVATATMLMGAAGVGHAPAASYSVLAAENQRLIDLGWKAMLWPGPLGIVRPAIHSPLLAPPPIPCAASASRGVLGLEYGISPLLKPMCL